MCFLLFVHNLLVTFLLFQYLFKKFILISPRYTILYALIDEWINTLQIQCIFYRSLTPASKASITKTKQHKVLLIVHRKTSAPTHSWLLLLVLVLLLLLWISPILGYVCTHIWFGKQFLRHRFFITPFPPQIHVFSLTYAPKPDDGDDDDDYNVVLFYDCRSGKSTQNALNKICVPLPIKKLDGKCPVTPLELRMYVASTATIGWIYSLFVFGVAIDGYWRMRCCGSERGVLRLYSIYYDQPSEFECKGKLEISWWHGNHVKAFPKSMQLRAFTIVWYIKKTSTLDS